MIKASKDLLPAVIAASCTNRTSAQPSDVVGPRRHAMWLARAVMELMNWSQISAMTRYQHIPPDLITGIALKVNRWIQDKTVLADSLRRC
jgi:hypothetical protein